LRYRLGQVVRVQATIPDWGKSYRVITSEANNTVALDRIINVDPGDLVFMRTYDTVAEEVTVESYTVASVSGRVLTIAETWSPTPVRDNLLSIGVGGAIKLRRIVKLNAMVENYFGVTLETYDPTLFDSDGFDPQITNPDYVWPSPPPELTKPVTITEVRDAIAQMLPPTPDTDIPTISNCTWTGSGGDTVTWSKSDANEPILFRYKGTTYQITPDNTTDEFIYWDPGTTDEFLTTNVAATALAAGNWLVCTNTSGVASSAVPMQLLHAAVLQAGTITAAYGQIANLAVTTLKIGNTAVTTEKLAARAATNFGSSYSPAEIECPDGEVTEIQAVENFISKGGAILIWGSYQWLGSSWHKIRIYRDAVEVAEIPLDAWYSDVGMGFAFAEQPGAGTYDYYLKVYNKPAEAHVDASNRGLMVMELTR